MKDSTVLKRAMFATPISKKTMNSGIMAGFEDEDMMEEDMAEESPPMARTPQNPEILMNNLRGDIRSIDARYLELAQMVGEEAAMDTPPEVLAMLQGQMGAQAAPPPPPAGGIGALPQAPQMPPEGMMPPGMEGALPFPQGGAEQAPPTPDGMPPLRAADGMFATQGNRFAQAQQNLQGDMDRMLALASGNIPQEQMTQRDLQLLQQYNASMGFGGGIRNVAQQGGARIASALSPYVERGRQILSGLDDRMTAMFDKLPSVQGLRVTPLRGPDGGRMVVQGRENIVPGDYGIPTQGVGTKFERANTLEVGKIPFSQALVESVQRNPIATGAAMVSAAGLTGTGAGAIRESMGGRDFSQLSPEELKATLARINQIPVEGMPRPAATTTPPPAGPLTKPPTEPLITPPEGKGPAPSQTAQEQLQNLKRQVVGGLGPEVAAEAPKVEEFIKTKIKEEAPLKTRAQRIKEEFTALEPTFRELLGDTKADARTNAMLLLADAGFKLASTYKPTMAMAIGEALSGVPRGFAAIVAQARDRDIKIKTAALQQATDNINLQDKYARDFQIESLKIEGKFMQEVFKARNAKELEQIKGRFKIGETAYKGDIDLLLEQIRTGGVKESDAGMGLVLQETKGGSFIGSYIKPGPKGELPPVVRSAIDSRWTLRPTDNPFVDNRGPAPTTVETDKGERVKLGTTLRGLDDSLRALDDLRGQYSQLYSPGTWFNDKINNIIVPISGGMVRPDVDQAAAATRINAGLNQVMKRIASANDQGRVAVQEQEWARDMLGGLTNPTAFFSNKEIAAKQFAAMEAQLRNARQQVLTQLGFVSDDVSMKVPSTGTQNDPFVISTDPQEQQRMFRYLSSTIGTIQDPRASVFIQMPNGRVDQFNPVQLRGLVQK